MILVQEPLRILAVLLVIIVGKSLPAIAIVLAFRHPIGTAFRVSAGLAQIGEFSFILAGLGVALGLLPVGRPRPHPRGRSALDYPQPARVDGGGAVRGVAADAAGGPGAAGAAGRPARGRAPRCGPREMAAPRGHRRVRSGWRADRQGASEQGLPFIIVESNRWRAEELRAQGLPVVWGDAAAPGVLEAAHVEHARLLVIATPDPFQGRRILELARRVNPRIDTVVRTHRQGELSYLERQGVGMAVMGERELALSMMNYALRSLGLSETRARVVVQGLPDIIPGARSQNRLAIVGQCGPPPRSEMVSIRLKVSLHCSQGYA